MFALNLPNVLTLLRILLVPVLIVALLHETANGDLLAAIIFAIASLTDAMDGYLARSRNAVTSFGQLMDPIADKLLIIAALVALVSLDRLAAWIAMVIIARELTVTITRMQANQQGIVIASTWWGKSKTIVQVAAIFFLIAVNEPSPWVDGLVYGAVVITVVSGIDYLFGLRRVLREADSRRELAASAKPTGS